MNVCVCVCVCQPLNDSYRFYELVFISWHYDVIICAVRAWTHTRTQTHNIIMYVKRFIIIIIIYLRARTRRVRNSVSRESRRETSRVPRRARSRDTRPRDAQQVPRMAGLLLRSLSRSPSQPRQYCNVLWHRIYYYLYLIPGILYTYTVHGCARPEETTIYAQQQDPKTRVRVSR